MQCGPAPLAAIKKGHIYIGYDTGFVFAEVNADRVEWIVKQEGSYNYIKGIVRKFVRHFYYKYSFVLKLLVPDWDSKHSLCIVYAA